MRMGNVISSALKVSCTERFFRFLTQTRPSANTESQLPLPTPSRLSELSLPTPSLGSQFLSPYLSRQTQEREPLGTLSFTPSQRAHKSRFVQRSSTINTGYQSSPSPSPSRKPQLPRPKVRLAKSEFVEGEAEESDEDEMRGFGVVHKTGDDEDLDGEDQDRNLESLVDDVQMDDETIAAEKVLEKVRYVVANRRVAGLLISVGNMRNMMTRS